MPPQVVFLVANHYPCVSAREEKKSELPDFQMLALYTLKHEKEVV